MASASNTSAASNQCHSEPYSLIWLDANVDTDEENIKAQRKLCQIIGHLWTFDNVSQCLGHISNCSSKDRLIFVVSGQLGQQVVREVHALPQISEIYIYCQNKQAHEGWSRNYVKVRGLVTTLADLITQISSSRVYKEQLQESFVFNIFTTTNSPDQSTKELNGDFVHSVLLIDVLLRTQFSSRDKQQLIQYCRSKNEHNDEELAILDEFDRNYSATDALQWYTKNSCIYRMLNKALRTQDIKLLLLFGFFIRDIYQQLKQKQCRECIRVYRCQKMSYDEIERLKQSMGAVISINSFFSTSRTLEKAMNFSRDVDDLGQVIFIIDADPNAVTTKPFADIASFSAHDEREILFMVGCAFRLVRFKHVNDGYEISMQLCHDDEYEAHRIFQDLKKQYAGGDKQGDLRYLAAVLHKMGKYDHAKAVYRQMIKDLPTTDPAYSSICRSLGMISEDIGDYDVSLKWYREAYQSQMQNKPSDYVRLAGIYCCIGIVYKKKRDKNKALKYYNSGIDLFRKQHDENHLDLASLYNNIAIIYKEQREYPIALDFYEKALKIEQQHLEENHPDIALSYNNIGSVYHCLGNYDLAMSYYQNALEIKRKTLPSNHSSIATSYANIARVYEAVKNRQEALKYFQKAADIRYKALGSDHPDVSRIREDIGRLQSKH